MADKLQLLPNKISMTTERYRIQLDDADRRSFAADPRAFLYELLKKVGAPPPNQILIGSGIEEATARDFVELDHIGSGAYKSYYLWPPAK